MQAINAVATTFSKTQSAPDTDEYGSPEYMKDSFSACSDDLQDATTVRTKTDSDWIAGQRNSDHEFQPTEVYAKYVVNRTDGVGGVNNERGGVRGGEGKGD